MNQGDGRFENEALMSGTAVNWQGSTDYCPPTDYEAPVSDVLYRNDGDGTFTDVTAIAGIADTPGTGLGVVCGDFTGDGRVDIFVANDGMEDRLWVNRGDGTFVDAAPRLGCAYDSGNLAAKLICAKPCPR